MKKAILLSILFANFFVQLFAGTLKNVGDVISCDVEKGYIIYSCKGGEKIRLDVLANDIIRLRMAPDGEFETSLSVKFGYVKEKIEDVPFSSEIQNDKLIVKTNLIIIETSLKPFRLQVFDKSQKLVFSQTAPEAISYDDFNYLNVDKRADEHFYGFGFMRETFDAKGMKLRWERGYRWEGPTVPFFMSTAGYGFYSNNTYIHNFDFTDKSQNNDFYTISSEGGQVDFFVFIGPGFKRILDEYTELTGKPKMVPLWAMSPEYRCHFYAGEEELLKNARKFREVDIPISIIGLEPGWEDKPYGNEYKWSPKRFPDPAATIKILTSLGYNLDVWETGDAPKNDFTKEEVRNSWFKAHIPLINMGVRMFKVDNPYPRQITSTELQDAVIDQSQWKSEGLNSGELVHLVNSLYTETVFNQFTKYSGGERAILMNHAYAASVASQRWPFQWGGDYMIGNARLNAGLSGHSIVSYDMDDPRCAPYQSFASRIHGGFMIPFTVMDSWCDFTQPWMFSKPVEDIYRVYAKLKASLYPYLYTSQWQSYKYAIPMLRPMVLEYQDDVNTLNMKNQYMLGDWLLVGLPGDENLYNRRAKAFNENKETFEPEITYDTVSLYLPKGVWFDYWTGNEVHSPGKNIIATWPDNAGGPLYIKGGAIIPRSQVTGYIGEEPLEIVELDIYPAAKSEYILYEDDGHTYQYEQGKYATTIFTCNEQNNQTDIYIGKRTGTYSNISSNRGFLIKFHKPVKPETVKKDNFQLNESRSKEELLNAKNAEGWYYDDETSTIYIKPSATWYYDFDSRGKGKDVERDKVFWTTKNPLQEGDYHINIEIPEYGQSASNKMVRRTAKNSDVSGDLSGKPGKYKLQVLLNPPEIVKLDDGSWMDGHINVFVTITDTEGNIIDSDMPVKFHATGQSDRIPADREVRAIHGIATFRDIFYKKPARYMFHISSDGIDTVDIPIFKTDEH